MLVEGLAEAGPQRHDLTLGIPPFVCVCFHVRVLFRSVLVEGAQVLCPYHRIIDLVFLDLHCFVLAFGFLLSGWHFFNKPFLFSLFLSLSRSSLA